MDYCKDGTGEKTREEELLALVLVCRWLWKLLVVQVSSAAVD